MGQGMYLDELTAYRRVLLLQGPIGPFFWRLANFLQSRGSEVVKVNLNGGDAFFFPAWASRGTVYTFKASATKWRPFLREVVGRHSIDVLVLFGDCRFYHRVAVRLARRLGIEVFVFEEGYIRPDYITLTRGGANGHSGLSHKPNFYQVLPDRPVARPQSMNQRAVYSGVLFAALYGLAGRLGRSRFPHYRHHRQYFSMRHGLCWVRGWLRKYLYRVRERNTLALLGGQLSKRFFLVPLQVHKDAQVLFHSPYRSIVPFVAEVIGSFAAHAPADTYLVFKHHPMDRGFCDYGELIARLAAEHGIAARVRYVHDVHLPSLLDHARGTVLINSTVGMSSLLHGTPVKVLGQAIYDMPGLAHQGPLAKFWQQPEPIDHSLFQRFRSFVIERTQVNGNYCLLGGFEPGRELHPAQLLAAQDSFTLGAVPRLAYADDSRTVVLEDIAKNDVAVAELPQPVQLHIVVSVRQTTSV
jgi:capsular polysaccharide export protein